MVGMVGFLEVQIPDAEGAEVAQKTQKIQKGKKGFRTTVAYFLFAELNSFGFRLTFLRLLRNFCAFCVHIGFHS
jgi:hypothetical protein